MIAVEEGNLGIVKQFLDAGFDPNQEGVLEGAIANRYEKIVQLLVDRGGDLKSVDHGLLFLNQSTSRSGLPVVRYALELGLDPNFKDPNSRVYRGVQLSWEAKRFGLPLLQAVNLKKAEYVDLLLKHGADPNLVEYENDVSALHLAVWHGQIEIVKSLLKAGAEIDRKTTTPSSRRGVPHEKWDDIISVAELAKPGTEIFSLFMENGARFPKRTLWKAASVGSWPGLPS